MDYAFSYETLHSYTFDILKASGTPPDIAEEVSHHLVNANLSGHDSHGVARLTQYLSQIKSKKLIPDARPDILNETGTSAVMDANQGFGQFSSIVALEWAIQHAHQSGIAAISVRHSMHVGRLGEYSERAANKKCIAIITAGSVGENVGGVLLPGARGRYFSTNPWSFGFPSNHDPVVFDAAMSTTAEGKVRLANATGKTLPSDCIVDKNGQPTTNPKDFYDGGALLPLGGKTAGHKGYGFSLASALLGGLSAVKDPSPTMLGAQIAGDGDSRYRVSGMFLIVIDPTAFALEGYEDVVDHAIEGLKRAPSINPEYPQLIPGEPEVNCRKQRSMAGITLPETTWKDLVNIGKKLSISIPNPKS